MVDSLEDPAVPQVKLLIKEMGEAASEVRHCQGHQMYAWLHGGKTNVPDTHVKPSGTG